ncbi:ferrochelatase [Thiohalobacter sp. IOR34]|uniref:ferrochelatase n=1 Tax=Thiohalobacter sp. IOR34 TaxID=3057176 RepID=UPI0025B0BCB7|nr:ferrochelatase [Thiohalobacter sp. IOR34]WJW74985.1 ferrochelatase [Thiohalobacter sp. IOR34]
MSRYRGETHFHHDAPACCGVLLTNLGTPEAPTPAALRRYLAEFLWDPRVVEMPRPLWWLLLHGVILRTRPARAARAYRSIWSAEGSPLLAISRRQQSGLQQRLDARLPGPLRVALGMRYGRPSIEDGLEELRAAGARRLLVLPLYPQYSATTTASTFDAVSAVLQRWRWLPALRFVDHYHEHPAYIRALVASIREHRAPSGDEARLLFSFHGLPRRYLLQGDPYHCECHKTARLVAEALQLDSGQWQLAFQSRFGREEWLKPYTDQTLKRWARDGIRRVQVVCPGFSADCLETLEEIGEQNRELFLKAGGEHFEYIPALNDRPDHLEALADIVCEQIQGWPEADPQWDAERDAAERSQRLERARRLGASG